MASGGSPIKVKKQAWSGGETLLAKAVARPMVKFMAQEAASGILLLIATIVALVWANSIWGDSYYDFWHTKFELKIGDVEILKESLEHLVNDALMVIFFFVVGLEIKSEMVEGDLNNPRVAALPAIAAVGGMLVPALIYYFVTAGTDGSGGWGIPMATDIAFALGVLALMGSRVPQKLKLFLLTLAIVDDIGGILVIAIFYSEGIKFDWLSLAVSLVVVIVLLRKLRVWYMPVYFVIGLFVWYATLKSGVHATISGVVLGVLTPAKPLIGRRAFETVQDIVSGEIADPVELRETGWKVKESVAVTTRLTNLLTPWTGFIIIPIFALANAGVQLSTDSLSLVTSSKISLGVILGLVVGKPLGILLFTLFAVKSKIAVLPKEISYSHILGGGAVAGIGFTLSLFIAKLAFKAPDQEEILNESIIGILVASLLATVFGFIILSRCKPTETETSLS